MAEKKLITFYVLKVLERHSDENHHLTQGQIISYVESEYGLTVDRKTIASAISSLISMNYDIGENSSKKGVALYTRVFANEELQYLIDSVWSSHSISQQNAEKLIKNILSLSSEYEKNKYKKIYKNYNNRTISDKTFYNISIIQEAILEKKQIKFKYLKYDINGKLIPRKSNKEPTKDNIYRISPYYLANNFGKYYVLGSQYNHDHIVTYRIDFINDIDISSLDAVDKNTLSSFNNFDISSYMNNHIYMMNNPVLDHVLRIQPGQEDNGINIIYDWFSTSAKCYKDKDDSIKVEVKSGMLDIIYFVLQYSDIYVLEGPTQAKNAMTDIVNKLKMFYK